MRDTRIFDPLFFSDLTKLTLFFGCRRPVADSTYGKMKSPIVYLFIHSKSDNCVVVLPAVHKTIGDLQSTLVFSP
jgi:hypothetical protein